MQEIFNVTQPRPGNSNMRLQQASQEFSSAGRSANATRSGTVISTGHVGKTWVLSGIDFGLVIPVMDVTDNITNNGNETTLIAGRKKKPKSPPLWNISAHLVFVELCLNVARIGNKMGSHFNKARKIIDASLEWWDEKIKDTNTVGDRNKLPLDCRLVDEDEKHQEGKGDDKAPLFPASSSSKRKKSNGSGRSTKGKNSVTSEFDERLDSVINALSSRSTQSFPPHKLISSAQDWMNIVTQFPEFRERTN
uniref:Uncharacterized protein n=1 Tax=Tanacetum cinerariifolium TaxID=118510 RepID=A0A699GN55_TANCI|nr:hypothetical protein [Tanacetum cinerariifolium]